MACVCSFKVYDCQASGPRSDPAAECACGFRSHGVSAEVTGLNPLEGYRQKPAVVNIIVIWKKL
jgi:hypothetical protein